jgi:hypothetical protein
MARRASDPPLLTLRELNRALLARQMLLERARVDPVTAIERLGALQAQWPPAPYVALWSRLARFSVADLEAALESRRVVKATLMRGTLHLASARDYPAYAVATPDARRALWMSTQRQLVNFYARQIPAAKPYQASGTVPIPDPAKLHAELLRHAATPRSRVALIEFIARRAKVPAELAQHLVWGFVAAHGLLVHVPASGKWSSRRSAELVAARTVLPGLELPALAAAVAHTVKRHLAAFGPATIDDVSSWTAIRTPPIRDAIASLGSSVRTFRDERGRTLYDLARAPRPPADTAAPPRFLPKWDSTLLAYTPQERVRILSEAHRTGIVAKNGDFAQTVLIDGMVGGIWELALKGKTAMVEVRVLGRVGRSDRTALLEEGERLARFVAPDAASHGSRITA